MGQGRLTRTVASHGWPQSLKESASSAQHDSTSWQPVVIKMGRDASTVDFEELIRSVDIASVIDNYDEQYAELVITRRPELYRASYEEKVLSLEAELIAHRSAEESWNKGSWVYYPWNKTLLHVLERDMFLELRSSRNRNLISADEQKTIERFNVGCAGMSVGSNVAFSIGISGCSQNLKIADGAVISGSNLNRIMANVSDIGLAKSIVVARKLYEMNPYFVMERFDVGVTPDNIADFFEQPWPIDLVVDEIDDLAVKLRLRIEARKRRLPVVMVTDLGDDVMLDVERFDLEPDRPLFHGLVDNVEDLLSRDVSGEEFLKYGMAIIGIKNASLRMQESVLQIGREIATQPQLGTTAIMAGAVAAYTIRKIALGEDIQSGRTIISPDKQLIKEYSSDDYKQKHNAMSSMMQNMFGL